MPIDTSIYQQLQPQQTFANPLDTLMQLAELKGIDARRESAEAQTLQSQEATRANAALADERERANAALQMAGQIISSSVGEDGQLDAEAAAAGLISNPQTSNLYVPFMQDLAQLDKAKADAAQQYIANLTDFYKVRAGYAQQLGTIAVPTQNDITRVFGEYLAAAQDMPGAPQELLDSAIDTMIEFNKLGDDPKAIKDRATQLIAQTLTPAEFFDEANGQLVTTQGYGRDTISRVGGFGEGGIETVGTVSHPEAPIQLHMEINALTDSILYDNPNMPVEQANAIAAGIATDRYWALTGPYGPQVVDRATAATGSSGPQGRVYTGSGPTPGGDISFGGGQVSQEQAPANAAPPELATPGQPYYQFDPDSPPYPDLPYTEPLYDRATDATGVFNWAQDYVIARGLGQVIPGVDWSTDAGRARLAIKQAESQLLLALRQSGRYIQGEMNMLEDQYNLGDNNTIWSTPTVFQDNLIEQARFLRQKAIIEANASVDPNVPEDERVAARNVSRSIQNYLWTVRVPPDAETSTEQQQRLEVERALELRRRREAETQSQE